MKLLNRKQYIHALMVILTSIISLAATAQADTAPKPLYLVTRQVPSFKLLLLDSATYYLKSDLKQKKATCIIYFNPDCEHCITELTHLSDSASYTPNIQYILASYAPLYLIKKLDSTLQLSAKRNIVVGRDERYTIPSFYKVRFTPFVALYAKLGGLLQVYQGGTSIANLKRVLKKYN